MEQLPKNAKLVFKGKIFEVWQWEQKMFDGSVQTFERLRRPDTAQVIAVAGDRILLLDQEQPDRPSSFLSLPGGRFDEAEQPLTASKRELLEETGFVSDDWLLLKKRNPVTKIVWTVYTYIARNCVKQQEPNPDAGERLATRLVTFDEFLMLSEHPYLELAGLLLRARFDPKFRSEFHSLLFPDRA